jgi:hypothetical protein
MDAIIASAKPTSSAVGNMGVNAKGDKLGPGGRIVQKSEDRVRDHYKNSPRSSNDKQSLKGSMPDAPKTKVDRVSEPKTAKTARENTRVTQEQVSQKREQLKQEIQPDLPTEPAEFDAPDDLEPLGYREVELPNGDIEMVPYYKDDSDGE